MDDRYKGQVVFGLNTFTKKFDRVARDIKHGVDVAAFQFIERFVGPYRQPLRRFDAGYLEQKFGRHVGAAAFCADGDLAPGKIIESPDIAFSH